MKKEYSIGIDISQQTLDVCVLRSGDLLIESSIGNSKKDLKSLFKEFNELGVNSKNCWVCAEHTGSYGLLLRQFLELIGFSYTMLPALEVMRSVGMTRGKNDKVDAKRIAEYGHRFYDKLRPTRLPEQYLQRLKKLFSFRKQRVKRSTMLKNQIREMQRELKYTLNDYMLKVAKKELRDVVKVIKEVEQQMKQLIDGQESANKNYGLVRSVNGVGHLTACYMLISTDNFTQFNDARKYASYSGIAPFTHSSGSSVRGRTSTSKLRNKDIKTLLISGVNSVIAGTNEFGVYYKRKIQEGKHKNVVKNAIAFKMINRIFAAVNRKTPYVRTYAEIFPAKFA